MSRTFITNITAIRKTTEVISKSMQAVLNRSFEAPLPRGFKLNTAKIQNVAKRSILSPSTASAIKKLLTGIVGNVEAEYRTALYGMMTGNNTGYAKTSKDFEARVRRAFPVSATSQLTHNWIMKSWGGDWYAYKRSLSRRRLVKTGKKDEGGKDVYRVYAGRSAQKQEEVGKPSANSNNYISVGELKSGDRAAKYNKTLRSTLTTKSGKEGSGRVPKYNKSAPEADSDFTRSFNPDKVGKRAAAQTGLSRDKIPSYAVARAVEMAEHLRNGTQPAGGSKTKNKKPKAMMPYAKTGKMADSYTRTFSFKASDIKVAKDSGANNQLNVTMSGNFKLGSMAAEYRRTYLRTPTQYKRILVYSAGNLFADVIDKQLFASKKFKRGP